MLTSPTEQFFSGAAPARRNSLNSFLWLCCYFPCLIKRGLSSEPFSMPSSFTLHRSLVLTVIPCLVMVFVFLIGPGMSQEQDSRLPQTSQDSFAASSSSASATKVSFGLCGNVRLGKWIPIWIETESAATLAKFEVSVFDGDDTPIVYAGDLLPDPNQPNRYQAWAMLGRTYGNLDLRLFDQQGAVIEELEIAVNDSQQVGEIRKSTQPILLTLESGDAVKRGIESISGSQMRGEQRIVSVLNSYETLPLNWLGYDQLESVILATSDIERVKTLSAQQIDALESWVKRGGTLVLSSAENSSELLAENGILNRFAPGKFDGMGESDGRRIESFADSIDQLVTRGGSRIAVSKWDQVQGSPLVEGIKGSPLVTQWASGLGRIVFVAFDLEEDRIAQWTGYGKLVNRLLARSTPREDEQAAKNSSLGSSVSHYGFKDIVGQLRVPLDSFTQVRFVAFSLIAVLIGLYILCIGPGDFFLLQKLFGKMELTWITFPLLSILFCGLAIWISWLTRPGDIQLNQLEIIDVDTIDERVQGSTWTNIYSPSGGSSTIEFEPNHSLGFEIDSNVLGWQGLPGDGLGGMLSNATPSLLKTGYRQEIKFDGQRPKSKIEELPLQVSSTKQMFGQWWSDNPIRARSRLRYNPKLQQVTGSVTNPFDFTLHNCRLVFENWAYVLDQPLEPGDTFDIVTETSEKNLKSLLTRRAKYSDVKKQSDNSPWDPTDKRINRIADIMMFYEAAGGENYTGLTHGYQSFTDMTELLRLQRAVLVGEVQSPGAAFRINGKNVSEQYDQTITIIRLILPVENSQRTKAR